MKRIRNRLTYANVMSSIAVFLVLGGATAVAASQLGKNSVGSKQLQKNAVTAAKIKKNAVTGAKIKKAAVTGAKIKAGAVGSSQIADGAVTGAEINPVGTPFTRITGAVRQTAVVPFTASQPYLLGSYSQPAGETDIFVPYMDVNFPASCTAPRSVAAFVLVNPVDPKAPTPFEIAGYGVVEDKGAGAVTRRASFGPFPGGYGSLTATAPAAATNQTFYVFPVSASCSSGSGVTLQGAGVDVLGTKAG